MQTLMPAKSAPPGQVCSVCEAAPGAISDRDLGIVCRDCYDRAVEALIALHDAGIREAAPGKDGAA